jgi:hypothetical protein
MRYRRHAHAHVITAPASTRGRRGGHDLCSSTGSGSFVPTARLIPAQRRSSKPAEVCACCGRLPASTKIPGSRTVWVKAAELRQIFDWTITLPPQRPRRLRNRDAFEQRGGGGVLPRMRCCRWCRRWCAGSAHVDMERGNRANLAVISITAPDLRWLMAFKRPPSIRGSI